MIYKTIGDLNKDIQANAKSLSYIYYRNATEKCLRVNNDIMLITLNLVFDDLIPNLGRKRSNRINEILNRRMQEVQKAFKGGSDPSIARWCEEHGIDHDYFFGIKKEYCNDPVMYNEDGELVIFLDDFEKEKEKHPDERNLEF